MNRTGMDPECDRDVTTWKGLARGLLAGYGDAVAKGRLQGILGVVRHGNDPRGLWRWIPLGDYSEATPKKPPTVHRKAPGPRSEEHTSELQSLMRISYAVFRLQKQIQAHTLTA